MELNLAFSEKQSIVFPQIEVHSAIIEVSNLEKELGNSSYPMLVFVANKLGKNRI